MIDTSLIRQFEGFRPQAYPDCVRGWDVPTIGYGTTHYPDGRAVQHGDIITEGQAEAALESYVTAQILPSLQRIPGWDDMSNGQQSALASFAYNLGANFYGSPDFHTITAALRERRWTDVPAAMLLYCNPGSSCHEGLLRRRQAEADLWKSSSKPATPEESLVSKLHLARVPSTGPDQYGLAVLELSLYDEYNNRIDHVPACSGQSYAQHFRRGDDPLNLPGNMEPLPEGLYDVSLPEWAGKPGDYAAVFNQGLGAVILELTPRFRMRRGSLLIHQDYNRETSPGTAGCCGVIGQDRINHVVMGWFGQPDSYGPPPRVLAVNWGLGSCPPIAEVNDPSTTLD